MKMFNSNHDERGFTLIELLVAVSIIGILASIGVSTYMRTRVQAFNAMAKSDLRNAISAEEAYFANNEDYIPCANTVACVGVLPGFASSGPQVSLSFTVPTSDTILGTASHSLGDTIYEYDSAVGAITEQ